MSTHTDAMSENAEIETGSNADPKAPGDPSGESVLGATPCSHDYENFVRKGRARYHCPKCGVDITFDVVMLADAGFYDENSQEQRPDRVR